MGASNIRGGRRPKPVALKAAAGNPGGRPLGREPQFDALVEVPEPPEWLGPHGVAEWNRTVPQLIREGILTEPDLPTAQAYCLAFQVVTESALQVNREGLLVLDPIRKRQVPHPLIAVGRMAARELRAGAAELGLSPMTRSRLAQRLPADDEPSDLELFVAQRNEPADSAASWGAA